MIGIYHSRDLDGYASGAIIKRKYPDAKMIGYDYGQPFDMDQIDGPVIMADVSMPMPQMAEIAKRSGHMFTWIDHHISAINEFREYIGNGESFCTAALNSNISACEGTWLRLFPEKTPLGIRLLGEYDTWKNADKDRWDNEILPFQFGMRLICNSVESFPSQLFLETFSVSSVINDGVTILKYQAQVNESACKKSAFAQEFEGYRAICLNGGGFNSDVFKSVYDEIQHDLMMPFVFNGKFWVVSIYTTKDIDCSAIAKKRGGGGHARASGFQVDDIRTVFSVIQ